MKLQYYIKYYIGCEAIVDGKERAKLIGGSFVPNSCNQIYYDLQTEEMKVDDIDFAMPYNDDADDPEPRVKPILHRLEDMTEDEAEQLAMIYSGAKSVERTKGVANNWHYYFCYFGENEEGELLIIAADGCAWYAHYFDKSQPGHRNIVGEHKAFHYLLQQKFDLFGLIDADLAIDIKTLTP